MKFKKLYDRIIIEFRALLIANKKVSLQLIYPKLRIGVIMTINNVKELLSAKVCAGQTLLSQEVETACGSDDMGDVMAYVKKRAVLLTGVLDPQVIRTAKMMDVVCIVFVRGKTPNEEILKVAEEMKIVVLSTNLKMFQSCGILYSAGLCNDAVSESKKDDE